MVKSAPKQKVGINKVFNRPSNGPPTSGGTVGDRNLNNLSGVGNKPRFNKNLVLNNGNNADKDVLTSDLLITKIPNGPTIAGGTINDLYLNNNEGVGNMPRTNNNVASNNGNNANNNELTPEILMIDSDNGSDISININNNSNSCKNIQKIQINSNAVHNAAIGMDANDDDWSLDSASIRSDVINASARGSRYNLRKRNINIKNNKDALAFPVNIESDGDDLDNNDIIHEVDANTIGGHGRLGIEDDNVEVGIINANARVDIIGENQGENANVWGDIELDQRLEDDVRFKNNLHFVCPIIHQTGRTCDFSFQLCKNNTQCLNHLNKYANNIEEAVYRQQLTNVYGFVRCATCHQSFCGTNGYNRHYRLMHAIDNDNPQVINNNNEATNGNNVDGDGDGENDQRAQGDGLRGRRLELTFIRSNDRTIIHEISKMSIKILQIATTAAGDQNNELLDKANAAFLLIPSIFAIIQAINKNRKLEEYRKRVLAYTSRMGEARGDEAYVQAIIDSYYNQYTKAYQTLIVLRKAMIRVEMDPIIKVERRAAKEVRSGKPRRGLRMFEEAHRMRRQVQENVPITVHRPLTSMETREYLDRNDLYPQGGDEELDGPVLQPEYSISMEETREVINTLNKETSAGVSGWTNEFLRTICDTTYNDQADGFTGTLARVLTLMSKNQFGDPDPWIAARLALIDKPDTQDLRPIAIGEVIRRVFGKVILRKLKDPIDAIMSDLQYGVGMAGGCEILAQKIGAIMKIIDQEDNDHIDAVSVDRQLGLALIDLKNAYGNLSRKAMDVAVRTHLPQLQTAFRFLYGAPSKIYHSDGEEVARVERGVQQGCVLAALVFCLGIYDSLKDVSTAHPRVKIGFFIDDGSVFGENRNLLPAMQMLETRLAAVGLKINGQKSGYYVHPDSRVGTHLVVSNEVSIPRVDYYKVLGVPSGNINKVEAAIDKKLRKAASPLEFMHQVPIDIAYVLLRFCITARPMYLARNVPSAIISERLATFDKQVDTTIAKMIGVTALSDRAKILRGLGITFNGMGVARLATVNRYAFCACFLTLVHHLQVSEDNELLRAIDRSDIEESKWILPVAERKMIVDLLGGSYFQDPEDLGGASLGLVNPIYKYKEVHIIKSIRIPRDEAENEKFDNRFRQKALAMIAMKAAHASLVKKCADSGDVINAVNIMCSPTSSAYQQFMLSGMSTAMVYRLEKDEFIEMLRRKLTVGICEVQGSSATCGGCGKTFQHLHHVDPEIRDKALTALTEHAGACGIAARDRHQVHNNLRDRLAKAIKDVVSTVDVAIEAGVEGYGRNNRMDIKVTYQQTGLSRLIDVGYVAASAQEVRAKACKPDGADAAIEAKQKAKIIHIQRSNLSEALKASFVPFIISNTGRVGPCALEFLNTLFEWNTRPIIFNARIANIRKHFIYSVGTSTARHAARYRIALRKNLTWSDT